MKNIFTLIALFILTNILAQTPEKFSYQAVIRNSNNDLVANTQIGMQISILKTSVNGTSVYTETHTQSTNANGLISVEIGTGNTTDDFSSIDWSNDTYFVKTETDPTGGTNYTITGTSQLLSVPYALHAKTATNVVVQSNTVREYEGFTEGFDINGRRTYKGRFNIRFINSSQWNGSITNLFDVSPNDPNYTGNVGAVSNDSGTYTENANTIIVPGFTFKKVGNTLTYFNSIPEGTTEINLTLKN